MALDELVTNHLQELVVIGMGIATGLSAMMGLLYRRGLTLALVERDVASLNKSREKNLKIIFEKLDDLDKKISTENRLLMETREQVAKLYGMMDNGKC